MRKEDYSRLLDRYLSARAANKEPYFDADEIEDMLNGFESSGKLEYYDEVLTLGLRLHPESNNLKVKKCQQYIIEEDFKSALSLIERMGEDVHEDIPFFLIDCYCGLKEYGKIKAYTEKMIRKNFDQLETLFEYTAPLLNDMEMLTEAREYIDWGLKLYPDSLILKEELCYILETEGEVQRAIEVYNEIIDNNPYDFENWLNIGRLYVMNSDFGKAIEAFDFALTCDESNKELKFLKAYCLFMNESYEKAIEAYKEIAADSEKGMTNRIKLLIAESYIKLENFQSAYELYHEIVQSNEANKDISIQMNYVQCCLETEHTEDALTFLNKQLEENPDNVRLLGLLSLAYTESGDDEKARETANHLSQIMDWKKEDERLTGNDLETLFQTGRQFHLRGDLDNALKYYQQIIEIDPEMPYIHLHLAALYMAKGDLEMFEKHAKLTTSIEIEEFANNPEFDFSDDDTMDELPENDSFLIEKLVKDFLNNKGNNN